MLSNEENPELPRDRAGESAAGAKGEAVLGHHERCELRVWRHAAVAKIRVRRGGSISRS